MPLLCLPSPASIAGLFSMDWPPAATFLLHLVTLQPHWEGHGSKVALHHVLAPCFSSSIRNGIGAALEEQGIPENFVDPDLWEVSQDWSHMEVDGTWSFNLVQGDPQCRGFIG